MDLKLINEIIKNKYSLSYKIGYEHFSKDRVRIVDVKEIDNITNIYGRVTEGVNTLFTHIKLSNSKPRLICNCAFSKETEGSLPCEHIIATILKLNDIYNYEEPDKVEESVKITLILEETFNKDYKFQAHLFLDGKGRIKLSSKLDLDRHVFDKRGKYHTGYTEENIKLLKMLGNLNFRINDKSIKRLFINSIDIPISIKIDSMKYDCFVKKERLPLKFSIKEKNDKICLQTVKIPIKALNEDKSVFLYDKNIYVVPEMQAKAYRPIYDVLHKRYYGYIKPDSLIKICKLLKDIGELNISQEIRERLSENDDIKLKLYMEKGRILAKFDVPSNKEYLLKITRVKNIEEILYLHKFTKKENKYEFLGEDRDLFYLLKTNISEYCSIETDNKLKNLGIISRERIKTNLTSQKYQVSLEGTYNDEWILAINSYNSGEEFYRFSNNNFIDFKDKDISSLMKLLSFIDYRGQSIDVNEGYFELIKEINTDFMDEINKNQEEDISIKYPIEGLNAKLRDYQKLGIEYLQNKKDKGLFGILADDMGLGKTIQTIGFVLNNKSDRTLIIAPTSLIYNWEAEFKKFAPNIDIVCIYGDRKKRIDYLESLSEHKIIITSYGTLNMDIEYYKKVKFDILIIDEAQNIKNSKAKVTKNVKSIDSKVRFALTGTPLENNYLELWSIFDYLKPGYLFSEREFKNKFLNSEENINYLKLMIKPFILRRTKKQVLKELPDKIETTYYVKMTDEQAKYYKNSLKRFSKEAESMTNQISILALLTKLRQIALDPSLIDEEYTGGSGKVDSAVDIINRCVENNKKVIIFSQFTSMLHRLEEKLNDLDVRYYYLDGKTNANDRIKLCDDFNDSESIKVFLISLKAGGTGINLTSAQVVVHFDPWWNPQVENQATDRAHRIGQKNKIEVIKMISKNTIEEKILYLKQEKSNIFTSLIEENESISRVNSKLSKEEINYLLSI